MSVSILAGKVATKDILVDIPKLIDAYYVNKPNPEIASQAVSFGTSGHRGTSLNSSFNENHILAISQAVCEYRSKNGITGPLFMGMDTHALSDPAHKTAIEVMAANGVHLMIHTENRFTPTPLVSFSILQYNFSNENKADGVVITPSHNPPSDGGFKYNPPHGGPADTDVTDWIQNRANDILKSNCKDVKRLSLEKALKSSYVTLYDFITPYVSLLPEVVNMDAIRNSGLRLCADALGGSSLSVIGVIRDMYKLDMQCLNTQHDPSFSFMTVDKDGKIRMDCSSPWAMSSLIQHSNKFDLAFANDPDADRHGIVTPRGLMQPNHYLASCINYLSNNRSSWSKNSGIGKTLVSSTMIDNVASDCSRKLYEVPVGFKWFVEPLLTGACCFGGEESAGASFLRMDGRAWSTDKDGIILGLLAAEMQAVTGKAPDEIYDSITKRHGNYYYSRRDAVADTKQKNVLKKFDESKLESKVLAGSEITKCLTKAPSNNASIGGIKVCSHDGWFAARPSGTEDIYKIYAESYQSEKHLDLIFEEAEKMVSELFARALA